jgi:hypothetical protein
MTTDRRIRLWHLVAGHARGAQITVGDVCGVAMSAVGVDGAAVTVVLDTGLRETAYASNALASGLAELVLTLGEGPGVDAPAGGGAVLVADLTAQAGLARWPVFAPAAVSAGAGAVFALPLQVGAARVGVMYLYRVRPGGLDGERLADALVLADTACALLLDGVRPDLPRRDGSAPDPPGLAHPEVHQATGMITVQLGVTAAVALMRLRAYAYANDRRLRDVAGDVVARRLRFEPEPIAGGGDGVHSGG